MAKVADTGKKYILNHIRIKEFDKEHILLTTDFGSWIVLNTEEFKKLNKGELKGKPLEKLENEGIILTEDNIQKVTESYKNKNLFLFQGPSLHIVVPTLRCNQKCLYCHSKSHPPDAKGYDMDKETAKKVVDFIFQTSSNAITIEFQGGEPLLNFDIVKYVIEYATELNKIHKKNLKFDLVTNLTIMDKEKLDYLVDKRIGICTSLDGPKIVHDKNRPYVGGGESYEDVVKWIEPIKAESPFELNALMVTTRNSLKYPKEIIDEYIKHGFKMIQLKQLSRLGYATSTWEKIGYTADEFLDFWKKSLDHIIEVNKKGTLFYEFITRHILKKILTNSNSTLLDLMSPCGAAIGQLAYAQDGNIYTCDEARMYDLFKLGNVKENTMKEVLTSEQTCDIVASSTNDNLICDACVWKPYCGVCPVCNYSEQGNLIPKLALSNRCKIYKGIFEHIFRKLIFDKEASKVFHDWVKKGVAKD